MNLDKWLDVVGMIKEKFKVEEDYKSELEEGPGEKHVVVFKMPAGRFKLERVVRPRVLDKKTMYTHRAGGETKVEYVYSPNETVDKLHAYMWNDQTGDWREVSSEGMGF